MYLDILKIFPIPIKATALMGLRNHYNNNTEEPRNYFLLLWGMCLKDFKIMSITAKRIISASAHNIIRNEM